jgi:hypothetical protein
VTLSEYRSTQSWQGAIDLTPGLMELAEQLPTAEADGLSLQLRQIMVSFPAAIASDLVKGGDKRFMPLFKLVAALEMIDKVYPALDTTGSKTALDKLADLLNAPDFDQTAAGQTEAPAAPAPATAEPTPPIIAEPAEEAPAAEPTHVQVQAAAPAPNGEDNVQPNSVQ